MTMIANVSPSGAHGASPSASGGSAPDASTVPFQNVLDQQTQAREDAQGDASQSSAPARPEGGRGAQASSNGARSTATSSPGSADPNAKADASKPKTDKTGSPDAATAPGAAATAAAPTHPAVPGVVNGGWLAANAATQATSSAPSHSSAAEDTANVAGTATAVALARGAEGAAQSKAFIYKAPAASGARIADGDGPDATDASEGASVGSDTSADASADTSVDAGARFAGALGRTASHLESLAMTATAVTTSHGAGALASAGDATLSQVSNAAIPAGTATLGPSVAAPVASSIGTPVGSSDFATETASKLLYFAQNNIQSAQLSLNPAHLGPLDVQIRMSGDQVSIALAAGHADTRHAIEAGLPKLREMFSDQGIQLGDLSVGARASSGGGGFQQHSGTSQGQTGAGVASATSEAGAALPSLAVTSASLQLVDTFA